MDKKYIILGLVCIILIIIGTITIQFNQNTDIQIGKTVFSMPNGFYEGTPNYDGDKNITDGKVSVFIKSYNDNNLNKHVVDYEKYKKNENISTVISNFTINNVSVSKITLPADKYTVHYWFSNNDEVYSIYSWDGNTDDIVSDLIRHMK